MRRDADFAVITDIGSTTTKAILLNLRDTLPKLVAIEHEPTTVETPFNDVCLGIAGAIGKLEQSSGIKLLQSNADGLAFLPSVEYLSTSSAGGGLQILVIGLTLFDSASSAKRCAYGAGGVILDTFAMDDKRQAMEQMLAMRNLHPDMILLCGGTDGGAISGVLRMAEIVRIADPPPKFSTSARIPALYAGNQNAAPIIKQLISNSFDLYILPNLRPSLDVENLAPTRDRIQQLFMENVMEQAPGYAKVKPLVEAPIIPTPVGVHRALQLISGSAGHNIFAFDIGGATTDVFSYINSHFQRTVSANLGMSYSAWNVLKETGMERILNWLPSDMDERTVRDYIANKCLHPTQNPTQTEHYRIEHALAREALSSALAQHRKMHYNGDKIGYLDKMKNDELCKYQLQFSFQKEDMKHYFKESDIDILIGAGGIFAHAQNHAQCMMMLVDAIRPKGITEVWIDRDFISPHLGVLSELNKPAALQLVESSCFVKLALHIAPLFNPKTKKPLLRIEVVTQQGKQSLDILPDSFISLPAGAKTLSIKTASGVQLPTSLDIHHLQTDLQVILDTRLQPSAHLEEVERTLQLYPEQTHSEICKSKPHWELDSGEWTRKVELPYSGDIHYQNGDKVLPSDLVAVNRYNPPRLYIVNGFSSFRNITPAQIAETLKVQAGDQLDFDQCYGELTSSYKESMVNRNARHLISPVRGKIEYIDANTGILVLSEIQDYSSRPVTVYYADQLMLKPKLAKRYLLRYVGDFVYQGELLAKRIERNSEGAPPVFVKSPATGTITAIDTESGTLTIAYVNKALDFPALVSGKVSNVVLGRSLEIDYTARHLTGKIAFGRECQGKLRVLSSPQQIDGRDFSGAVLVLTFAPDAQLLKSLAKSSAVAAVCYQMDATQLTSFLDFEPGVINTGNESLPLTILILDSFGSDAMPPDLLNLIPTDTACYLNPHTRIRAGVVRPFISF